MLTAALTLPIRSVDSRHWHRCDLAPLTSSSTSHKKMFLITDSISLKLLGSSRFFKAFFSQIFQNTILLIAIFPPTFKNWSLIYIAKTSPFWSVQFSSFQYIHKVVHPWSLYNFRTFSSVSKGKKHPLAVSPSSPPASKRWQSFIWSLLQAFHINWSVSHVAFRAWLSTMFSKFTDVARASISFLTMSE